MPVSGAELSFADQLIKHVHLENKHKAQECLAVYFVVRVALLSSNRKLLSEAADSCS